MKIFLHLIPIIILSLNCYAQSNCPVISVTGPAHPVINNENIRFTANISKDFNTSNLKFLWTVSAGEIVGGQGTLQLIVTARNNNAVTAALTIQGLPANCTSILSETYICSHCVGLHTALKTDEYEWISINKEKLRLDSFASALKRHPTAIGFITKSFTRNISKDAAYRNLQHILNYLKLRGIDENYINFGITYGKRILTETFIIPAGAPYPEFNDEILNAAQLAAKLKSAKIKSQKAFRRKN